MARWQDMFRLIQQGLGAHEIMETLRLKPYRFRQLLRSRHIQERLAAEEELALRLAVHHARRSMGSLAGKLKQIALSAENAETARKACNSLTRLGLSDDAGVPPVGGQEPAEAEPEEPVIYEDEEDAPGEQVGSAEEEREPVGRAYLPDSPAPDENVGQVCPTCLAETFQNFPVLSSAPAEPYLHNQLQDNVLCSAEETNLRPRPGGARIIPFRIAPEIGSQAAPVDLESSPDISTNKWRDK